MASEDLPIRRRPIVTQVAERLEEMIISGELAPGTALRDSRLAPHLEVARNTVREAVRGLVPKGLVLHLPDRGFIVPELTSDDVADLYNARLALDLAAGGAPLKDLRARVDALEEALERMVEAHGAAEWGRVFRWHVRFHSALVAVLGSHRLERFLAVLFGELQLAMVQVERQRPSVSQIRDGHRALIDPIVAGNRSGLRKALRNHIEVGQRRVIEGLTAQTEPGAEVK